MDFGTLALVVACGLAGPVLAGSPRLAPPLVVGEILAGVLVGRTGLDVLDPDEPGTRFLAQVGFALLMFVAGTHLPLRDRRLRGAAGRGVALFALTVLAAAPVAALIAWLTSLDDPLIVGVLLVTGSAALCVPALQEADLLGTEPGLEAIAWVTVADVVTIVAVPFVTVRDGALGVAVGGVAVLLATVLMWLGLRELRRTRPFRRLRRMSKRRRWGLDLRISLLMLFTLAWLATTLGTSILVAGFTAGMVVAAVGSPRRLVWQVLGIAEGLFVPLFFVTLGARLDLRELVGDADAVQLAVLLAAGVAVCHVAAAVALRRPVALGLVASAQMGVPAAVVSVGLDAGLLTRGEGAAVMGAALVSVAVYSIGIRRLGPARPTPVLAATPGAAEASRG